MTTLLTTAFVLDGETVTLDLDAQPTDPARVHCSVAGVGGVAATLIGTPGARQVRIDAPGDGQWRGHLHVYEVTD